MRAVMSGWSFSNPRRAVLALVHVRCSMEQSLRILDPFVDDESSPKLMSHRKSARSDDKQIDLPLSKITSTSWESSFIALFDGTGTISMDTILAVESDKA